MDSSPIAKRMRTDPPVVEQTAEIFNVNIDCMENIFDYLALEDVCAFGMTCKRMQQVAGKYFQQFYPMHRVIIGRSPHGRVEEQMSGETEEYPTNFGRFADDLDVIYSDIGVLRYASEIMSENLKSISLYEFQEYSAAHEEYVAKLVQNVECLTFAGLCDRHNFTYDKTKYGENSICYDDILKHCHKLKCLKFECDWNFKISGKYPQIEHLILMHPFEDIYNIDDFDMDTLIEFLNQNSHIKKLSIIGKQPTVGILLDYLKKVDLKLDELSAVYDQFGGSDNLGYDNGSQDEIIIACLKGLYQQGKYKELDMKIANTSCYPALDDYKHATEIKKVEIFFRERHQSVVDWRNYINEYGDDDEQDLSDEEILKRRAKYIEIPSSSKYLRLKGWIYIGDARFIAGENKQLEYLRLEGEIENGVLDAFASHLPALKEIIYKNHNFDINEIKLEIINDNRENLENPQKLTIYLPEKEFLQLKWSTIELEYGFVEVKRLNDSCMQSPLNEIIQRHGGDHMLYSKYFH